MILRLLLSLIYLYAGLSKAFNPVLLQATIQSYFPLPNLTALLIALVFPWIEVIAALALLFKWKAKISSGFLMLLSGFFFLLILLNYNNVLPFGCGCFGFGGQETIGLYHVIRDLLIVILASFVFIKEVRG